jgi:pSer/pThr/pTyr-binding forkhead associated (FHA) protein
VDIGVEIKILIMLLYSSTIFMDTREESAILLAQTGPLNGKRWTLDRELLLGREQNCDIVITDRQVSRHHAKVLPSTEGIILKDLKSKNGTHLNGQKILEPVMLKDGDVVMIAYAQQLIFLSSDATLPLDSQQINIVSSIQNEKISSTESKRRLRIDRKARRVWIHTLDKENDLVDIEITPPLSLAQFRLLEQLYINQGRVVSRFDLITTIWGESQALEVSMQALDALVRRLRDRIASIDPEHNYIITVRGHGLRLENPPIQ